MGELSSLPNIGKAVEEQLFRVGIKSALELKRIGAKEAWLKIQEIDETACIHRLMALEGAIQGVKKTMLSDEVKADLKEFYQRNKRYDVINPTQYIFHEDTETCTPVYTTYYEDYETFYKEASNDVEQAKKTREYGLDMENHPNWFDASYISWMSYDSLNIELPDGHLFFAPIINWGKYREEKGRLVMPVSVRLNHAIADGYLVANVYRLLEKEITAFCC